MRRQRRLLRVASPPISRTAIATGPQQENERLLRQYRASSSASPPETRFFVSALNSYSQLPGSITKAQLNADPEQANAASLAGRQKRDYDLYRLANRTVIELERTASSSSPRATATRICSTRSSRCSSSARTTTTSACGSSPSTSLGGLTNRIVIGATPSWNRGERRPLRQRRGQQGRADRGERPALTQRHRVCAGSSSTVSASVDARRGPAVDRLVPPLRRSTSCRTAIRASTPSYARVAPKLGLPLAGRTQTGTVYGNVSDSFEPPTFGELTGGPGVDLLDAQHARTVELGTRGRPRDRAVGHLRLLRSRAR